MRLGCPNCDAQYEVDDAAIPAVGRDVQCSNCGHTWFQLPAAAAAAPQRAPAPAAAPARAPAQAPRPAAPPRPAAAPPATASAATAATVVAPPPAPAPEPRPAAAPPPSAVSAALAATVVAPPPAAAPPAAEPEPPAPPPPPAPAPAGRRTLDDNLMAILREEAAREAAERKVEAERTMQVQPDLGLQEAPKKPAPKPADPRFADLSSPEPDAEAEAEAPRTKPPSRRSLLPDIEEINSTLRPGADHRGADTPAFTEAAARRKGFGAGFMSVILCAIALALVYVFAPRLAEAVPAIKTVLERYVAAVDTVRVWLDAAIQNATGILRGLSGEGDPPA